MPVSDRGGTLRLAAARDGQEHLVAMHQDVRLYFGMLAAGEEIVHHLHGGHAWVQVIRAARWLNGTTLAAGNLVPYLMT
jgi:hypothetical protein